MGMTRAVVALITLGLATGCHDRSARDGAANPVLLGEPVASADTLETQLIGLKRNLVAALINADAASLGGLIAADFRVYDTRSTGGGAVSLGRGERPAELSYIEVLAGSLGDGIDGSFDSFHVTHDDAHAVVYAIGMHIALRSAWRRSVDGWQATQVIVGSRDAAQRMIDERS
jgi:hypothetical protein